MIIPATPFPEDPRLFDKPIMEMQRYLKSNLAWLKIAFGNSQKLTRLRDGREYTYPVASLPGGVYLNLYPNEDYGNYCFFELKDPEEVNISGRQILNIKSNFNLIFWFNVKSILGSTENRNVQKIKEEILNVLVRDMRVRTGRVSITGISEENENIFKGYSIKETESQYLCYPYAGLKISGTVESWISCSLPEDIYISNDTIYISDDTILIDQGNA